MKLQYFDLLSPNPIKIEQVGGIISPKLKDISSIGMNTYQYYLTIILLDVKTYFSMIGQQEQYEVLPDEDKVKFNIFDLLTGNQQSIDLLLDVLNFFICEKVSYSVEHEGFIVYEETERQEVEELNLWKRLLNCFRKHKQNTNTSIKVEKNVIGLITKENYSFVCDAICQRNCVKYKQEDLSKVKSKKALEIMKKIQKGKSEMAKQKKTDKNMELGNIISAVANKSQSLNEINIWDLTIFQLWDCFARLSNNSIYDIQSMSVAAWGNKDNYFDATAWFKRIDEGN